MIAVIGILASIIVASLNSARTKGKVASAQANLRNMIPAAELYYDSNGSYTNICAAGGPLEEMMDAIVSAGGTAGCYTHDGKRWAVGARIAETSLGVDSSGAGIFGPTIGPTVVWSEAMSACAASGKKLPTLDQLKALYIAFNGELPAGFTSAVYWSSTEHPTVTANAYYVHMQLGTFPGSFSHYPKTSTFRWYCVG